MKIRDITTDEDFERLRQLRLALNVGGESLTPQFCDARIEDGFARRGQSPINLYDVCGALGLRDTRDVPFLKNAVRAFLGWPPVARLDRVHLDENGADLPWVKGLRERLRLHESANVQTILRTALAALPGDPWLELKGSCTSTLQGVLGILEPRNSAGEVDPKGRVNVDAAKAHVRQCLKNFQAIEREGVPRVWSEASNANGGTA